MSNPKITKDTRRKFRDETGHLVYRIIFSELIKEKMEENCETLKDIVGSTLTDEELYSERDEFHLTAFTFWTKKRVYFPVTYDCQEWIDSVPRNPCAEKTEPIGG